MFIHLLIAVQQVIQLTCTESPGYLGTIVLRKVLGWLVIYLHIIIYSLAGRLEIVG